MAVDLSKALLQGLTEKLSEKHMMDVEKKENIMNLYIIKKCKNEECDICLKNVCLQIL